MYKIFYIILFSLCSLLAVSCSTEDESSVTDTTDDSSVTLKMSDFIIDTTIAAGTIQGSVLSQSTGSALDGVSVSFTASGSATVISSSDSDGAYSQALTLDNYTITYSKSGYLNETQLATLETDNETLVVTTMKLLSESCTSGIISGTIKDAVNNNPVSGVSLSIRSGLNDTSTSALYTTTTSSTGEYSFSSLEAGWYTIETSKTGYITSAFLVVVCGDQTDTIIPDQDASISTLLDNGAMRIVLSWKTSDDLDAHLTGPDNLSGIGHYNAVHEKFHLYYPDSFRDFYYVRNNFSCSGCSASQMSDNVTLDLDSPSGIGTSGGPETITIAAVRSGSYKYYVHNFSQKGNNNLNLADAETSVKVYCNDNSTTTVTTYDVPYSAGDLWTVFGFSNCNLTLLNEMGSDDSFTVDVFAPTIAEVTAVTTPTSDNTPNYTFSSNESGTITYGGSCSSSTTSGTTDNNTITFNALSDGNYDNCTIAVTDSASNTSDNLTVSSFVIDTTGPTLSEITAVTTPSNDNTSSYTFSSTEAGSISYGGSCSSDDNSSVAGNNTITFNELSDGTYTNCTITVTDGVSNASSALSVSSFTIDTTGPTLSEVTPVTTPDNDSTPDYVFSSNEAGTISYGGSCSSSTTSASSGNNSITFSSLADGTYSDCTIIVTDSASNPSASLTVTSFTIAIPPVLSEVTAVPTPSSDNSSTYTFSSTEAGTITYGGSCSSSTTSAIASNNTVTFNELPDGTYDNCTIAVTDNTSNTSDNLSVSSFTIGAIKPALVQVTAVPTLTNDNTSDYSFFTTLAGSINYSGGCTSDNNTAVADNNTITFSAMAEGTYSNCTLTVTSNFGVESDNLSISSFTIDTIAPSLSQVTAVSSATNDSTPDYTFSSSEAGTITYGGSCSSSTTAASASNNTVTFNSLSDGTYNDCTITVTDNATNPSSTLSVNSFTVDTVTPTLSQVTAVPSPDNDSTPDYTFSSSEAGSISYGGDCSSADNSSIAGNNTVTFNTLSDGTYSNCTITVSDNASNNSSSLSVNSFTIGAETPALVEVTSVDTPSSDNTSTYTFYSTLSGSISYGGGCSSSSYATAVPGNNTVTFDALADGTYNCTITVTNGSNTSSALSVSSFVVDTTAPTLSSVTISSNNSKDSTKAKVGNIVTLSITSAETTQSYTVSIAGETATVSGSGTSWQATYTMPSSYSEGAVSFSIGFSDASGNSASTVTSTTNGSAVQFDKTAPTLAEVSAVTSPTSDTTPTYIFSSNEAGTISYGGSCSSSTTSASTDNNTITFSTLSGGTYSNCTITVTDSANNASDALSVSTFVLDTTAPTLAEVTAVSTPTSDNSSEYTFSSDEAGTISYGGSCSSSTTSASASNNTITFNELPDGTYDNCTIAVTDSVNNTSSNLSVSEFTIGAKKPALLEVTAVSSPTSDNTSNYTFYSTLAGTISYGGSCSSSTTAAAASNNTITLNELADGTYNNCTLVVTGTASGLSSDNLSISSFTIDTTSPSISEVTAVTSPTSDSTPNYIFSSNEAGTITYGGSCSSTTTSASASNNTITFSSLSDGTYSNCTITVTDNASNTSSALSVSTFIVDTTAPTLSEQTAVTTPTSDNTSSYTFSSNEAGTITYGGSCSSSTTSASSGNNTITFNELADGTYSNCTISVTDNASNTSSTLSVSSFTIDTTGPTLSEVTAVTSPTNDTTPNYTFSSNEAGTITYGGSCSSSTSSASSGNNVITFSTLSAATYSDCTISVSDSAGNTSDTLSVSSFIIDTTAPTILSTSPTDNESSIAITDNISVTFSESMSAASVTTNTSNTSCSGSFQMSSDSFSSCIQMASSPSSSDNTTFSITPSPKPFYSTTYKIRVTTDAEDSAGNNIASQYTQTYGFGTSTTFPTTAGSEHTCTILENRSVKCWGKNDAGQLGLGDTNSRGDGANEMGANLSSVDLGTGRTAKAIAAAYHATCAILDNSSIKCWGINDRGQLGQGNTNSLGDAGSEMGDNLDTVDLGSGRTATAIAGGGQHYCAILDNASIKCWGYNNEGQLGIGSTDSLGDGANEMGDNLSSIDLGTGRTATAIATGGSHNCAILDNAAVKCWGRNDNGQLGLGDQANRGDGTNEMGDNLNAVDLGTGRTAVSITAGFLHTCALLDDYSVKCWGDASYGQMGTGKEFDLGDAAGEMGDSLTAIDLGTGRTATAIAASLATCAVLDNSSIKCWGANALGQLGLGDTTTRGNTVQGDGSSQMGDNLPSIDLGTGRTARGVITGDYHTCTIMDNSSIKCWGHNASGQLGIGDTDSRGDGASEMGDNLPSISF